MHKEPASFFDRVYEVVRKIPVGRVTTYGAIAVYLGEKRSARMVGWAMNCSHNLEKTIPAHRVVNRQGVLTGKYHFPGTRMMQELLESEGLEIVNDTLVNFTDVYWEPLLD